MESVQLLTAEQMKARATFIELSEKRKAKEKELDNFRKDNGETIDMFHRLINELEDTTRAVSKHLVKHPYL